MLPYHFCYHQVDFWVPISCQASAAKVPTYQFWTEPHCFHTQLHLFCYTPTGPQCLKLLPPCLLSSSNLGPLVFMSLMFSAVCSFMPHLTAVIALAPKFLIFFLLLFILLGTFGFLCSYFPQAWHFPLNSMFVSATKHSSPCVTPSPPDLILHAIFMHLITCSYIMSVSLTSLSTWACVNSNFVQLCAHQEKMHHNCIVVKFFSLIPVLNFQGLNFISLWDHLPCGA